MKETQKQILLKEIQELEDHLKTLAESVDELDKDKKLKELNFTLGQKYADLDEYDKAIEHFENAISFLHRLSMDDAEKAEVYYHLAKSYDRSEQSELAFNTYHQALGFDNDVVNGFIHHQLGNWYFSREEWSDALVNYTKAIDYHVDTGKLSELGKNYHMIGAVYANQQINKEALQNFEKSFEWNTQTQNYNELGKSFFNLRIFLKHAMSFNNRQIYYQNLLHESEENEQVGLVAFIYHNLGLWFLEDSKYEDASKCFEKSILYKNENHISYELGSTYYHAGSCLESLNDSNKAFEYHIFALSKMLNHAQYDEVGMVVYYLQTSIHDVQDNKLKSDALKLIREAESLGMGVEVGDLSEIEKELEENYEEILTNESFSKTIEEVAEIEEKQGEQPKESIQSPETNPEESIQSPETNPEESIQSPETNPEESIQSPETNPEESIQSLETNPEESIQSLETNPESQEETIVKAQPDLVADLKPKAKVETSSTPKVNPNTSFQEETEYALLKKRLPDSAEEYGIVSLQRVKKLFGAYKDAWFGKKRKKQIFEETRSEVLQSFEELVHTPGLSHELQSKLTNWKSQIESLH